MIKAAYDLEQFLSPLNTIGTSDSSIVKGLVAILIALYSGKTASQILAIDPELSLGKLELTEHLSRQRANGVSAIIARITEDAAQAS